MPTLQAIPPEQIVNDYDVATLDQVYLVIGYYLRHKAELDDYLKQRKQEATAMRQQIEADFPPKITCEMLLERLAGK
jgi:hypothetical protein